MPMTGAMGIRSPSTAAAGAGSAAGAAVVVGAPELGEWVGLGRASPAVDEIAGGTAPWALSS